MKNKTFNFGDTKNPPRCTKNDPDFGHAICPKHGEKCPPVVSASPAPVCGQFTGRSGDGTEWHCTKPKGHSGSCNPYAHIRIPAAQPTSAPPASSRARCRDCGADYAAKYAGITCSRCDGDIISAEEYEAEMRVAREYFAAAQPVAANPPVEEVVKTHWEKRLLHNIPDLKPHEIEKLMADASEDIQSWIDLLRPFITQVSQPPTGVPGDILEHEYRHEHGLLEPGECPKVPPPPNSKGMALGQMLKLVEDGVLVRNIQDDGNMTAFVEQSARLARVLKQAQEALA